MEQRDICHECHDVCEDTLVNHCLEQGGAHMEPRHVKLLLDCIQICQTSADFMHRNSEYASAVAIACAGVCEACANSCDKFDSEEMRECARVCRECAEYCRSMGSARRAA